MKNIKFYLALVLAAFVLQGCGCSRIDAGHTGIKVNLYGSNKGVDNVREVTGMVWYNPFTTSIFKWPLFVQNSVYTADKREGSEDNQEFRVTTKDGLVVAFDVSMNWRVEADKVTKVFVKYRKDLQDLSETIMRNYVRKGFNTVAGRYTAEQLYEARTKFQKESEKEIKTMLQPEGFVVEQVVLLNELRLPKSVTANITQKINARQMALRKQEEVEQAKADAEKLRQAAEGEADARMINAEAEAKANRVINSSLSSALVNYYQVKQWNGVTPQVVSDGTGLILDLKGRK